MQVIFESIFDLAYLCTVLILGLKMLQTGRGKRQYVLYGSLTLLLGCGDAFHLLPRIVALSTTGLANHPVSLGIGKLITSVTMTIFYLLLYYVWRSRYHISGKASLTGAVWLLSLVRIVLCLFPQNHWTQADAPLSWGIARNIPFVLLGILLIVLFFTAAKEQKDKPFRFLWLALTLSFACYIPVVLFADAVPMVGILMLPKTCAYVWAAAIGYRAMKGDSYHEKIS